MILEPNKVHLYENITIKNGGTITTEKFQKDNKSAGILRLYCLGTLLIEDGGKIDVSGLGWHGGQNSGLQSDGKDSQGMSEDEANEVAFQKLLTKDEVIEGMVSCLARLYD